MFSHARKAAALALALALPLPALAADPPVIDSAMSAAINDLGSPDYAERTKAIKTIDSAFLSHAVQLFQSDDIETTAAIDETLQFQRNLSAWLLTVDRLPPDTKQMQLQVIQSAEVKSLTLLLFSPNSSIRADGVSRLAILKNNGIDMLLGYFLHDEDPNVAIAVLEAFWDRPPTAPAVDAVWESSIQPRVNYSLLPFPQQTPPKLNFRGKPLMPRYLTMTVFGLDSDARVQAGQQLLTHWGGPEVAKHLSASLTEMANELTHLNPKIPAMINNVREPMQILTEIAEGAHLDSTIPQLYAVATSPLSKGCEMSTTTFYISTRTQAIGSMLTLIGEQPASFGMKKLGGTLWESSSQSAELSSLERLQTWWKTNADHYTAMAAPSLPPHE